MCRNNCLLKEVEGNKILWQFENNKEVYDVVMQRKNRAEYILFLPDILAKADELRMDETLLNFVICTEMQERNRFLNNLAKNVI